MFMHPIPPPPLWIIVCLRSIGFLIDNRWILFAAVLGGLGGAIIAYQASGMCDTIPERRQNLCDRLGYNESGCTLRFDEDKKVQGVLEITIDEYVSEPDVEPMIHNVRATSVRVVTRDAEAVQIYMVLNGLSYEQTILGFAMGLSEPPCAFASCVRKRTLDPEHRGLTKRQLANINEVVNHILYQTGDSEQIAEFQTVYESDGIPTITKVFPHAVELTDQSGNNLASVLSIPVTIEFALPPEAR